MSNNYEDATKRMLIVISLAFGVFTSHATSQTFDKRSIAIKTPRSAAVRADGASKERDFDCSTTQYSDRWEMPLSRARLKQNVEVFPLTGCDFLVVRASTSPHAPPISSTFFGRKSAKAIDTTSSSPVPVEFLDGTIAQRLPNYVGMQGLPVYAERTGMWISEDDARQTVPGKGCYFGPLSHNIRISRDRSALDLGGGAKTIAVFQITKQTRRERVSGCIYGVKEDLKLRLRTMEMTKAWPLADGGFLVLLDNELIVRLDGNLQTKSRFLGDSFFIVEAPSDLKGSQVERLLAMPILSDFNSKCGGVQSLCTVQLLHDELLSRLLKSKQGGK